MPRLITWNINSVRLRMPLIKKCAEELKPDIICLQETKVENNSFPLRDLREIGFVHVLFHGQKSYNGVAIASRIPLESVEVEKFGGNNDARHIAARLPDGVELHNFYVPAGGDIPDTEQNPKFAHKLQFMDDITRFFRDKRSSSDNMILVGDMNIAPLEHDVWSHKQLLDVVSHTPIEVEKMNALLNTRNWVDTHRHFVPSDQKLYSWWSYRNQDWSKSDRGRRLDHIWMTPSLKPKLSCAFIHKEARDWERPSDHVPVVMEWE